VKKLLFALALAAFALAAFASPSHARVPPRLPEPMQTAPVARAIANVSADASLSEAQRERLLGRLHLIAYAQGQEEMTQYSNGEWQPPGQSPCGDRGYQASQSGEYRCPYGYDGLQVARELPVSRLAPAERGSHHLRSARSHYERSLALDDSNLRAHLGLAYVLDEMREREAARRHLRRIIALSNINLTQGYSREYTDWEAHAVLSEAVEHLGSLARSAADRNAVARLRERLRGSQPNTYVTPIVAPLADTPFEALIDARSRVAWDFSGQGDTRAQGWLTPDAAWLVWDPEQRGDIRSGFDMIGQRTWAVFWSDGFEAMRSLDDNRDGELAGAELEGLALWRDADSDGVSDPGEVLPLAAHGVAGLSVRGAHQRPDLIVAPAGVHLEDGRTRPLYDWTPGLSPAPNS
jgi:hypothetical protein